ncbi:unnamed protein product [Schistocephalus solidus]|uniref:PDZ domain-containing protein n=1 Tax=Schistocephalus solidus TaxID=70667 RepID=A0A183SK31_SCHSO|nr:unnamed protein product [Schistocephalus solidus]
MDWNSLPRVIVLQKGNRGYGFVVQSKRVTGGVFCPTIEIPSLHYLGHVEENNVAYRANLRPGDFILEVNNNVVTTLPHQAVVDEIRNSGEMLSLKVITIEPQGCGLSNGYGGSQMGSPQRMGYGTVSRSQSTGFVSRESLRSPVRSPTMSRQSVFNPITGDGSSSTYNTLTGRGDRNPGFVNSPVSSPVYIFVYFDVFRLKCEASENPSTVEATLAFVDEHSPITNGTHSNHSALRLTL